MEEKDSWTVLSPNQKMQGFGLTRDSDLVREGKAGETYLDRLKSAGMSPKAESKALSSSVKQLLREGLSLSEVRRVTLRALGSDMEEIQHKLANTKVTPKPKSKSKSKSQPTLKLSTMDKSKKRLREHQGSSGDLSRPEGGNQVVLDAAWKMFFDAQEPRRPETEEDLVEQLKYINSDPSGDEEKDALNTPINVSPYAMRNNSLFLPELGRENEDRRVQQEQFKRRRQ